MIIGREPRIGSYRVIESLHYSLSPQEEKQDG